MREAPTRCPKCGSGNIIGYEGEWECMDCGYKFRTEQISVNRRYAIQERTPRPTQKSRSLKRIFALILAFMIVFSFGLILGYGAGLSNVYTKTLTITKTVTMSYTISQTITTSLFTETSQATTETAHQTSKTSTTAKVYTTTTGYGFGNELEIWNIKKGETIIINGGKLALTVADVKVSNFYIIKFVDNYCEYQSDENYKFVLVYVKVDNLYKREMPFPSLWDMIVVTDKGYEYEWKPSVGTETSCSSKIEDLKGYLCETYVESLRPGESATKCYLFEIKEDHQPITLKFLVPEQYPKPDKLIIVTIG